MVVPNSLPTLPSFLLLFCLCLPQCIKCSSMWLLWCQLLPSSLGQQQEVFGLEQSSTTPSNFQHCPPTSTPLVLSFQNTKTGDGHFCPTCFGIPEITVFPMNVAKKQRFDTVLHFQPSGAAILDRVEISWICFCFGNYPHYHLMWFHLWRVVNQGVQLLTEWSAVKVGLALALPSTSPNLQFLSHSEQFLFCICCAHLRQKVNTRLCVK